MQQSSQIDGVKILLIGNLYYTINKVDVNVTWWVAFGGDGDGVGKNGSETPKNK